MATFLRNLSALNFICKRCTVNGLVISLWWRKHQKSGLIFEYIAAKTQDEQEMTFKSELRREPFVNETHICPVACQSSL